MMEKIRTGIEGPRQPAGWGPPQVALHIPCLRLQYLDYTTIMIFEVPTMSCPYSVFGIEEFITDGVILVPDLERK
jgi:hypothetical protein